MEGDDGSAQHLPSPGAHHGDAKDVAALYRLWIDAVRRWANVLGGPGVDGDDVAHDVFLVVRRKLPDFRGGDPGPWLYAITFRVTRAARRRAWFRHALLGQDDAQNPV